MATMLRLKLQVGLDNFQHILVLTNWTPMPFSCDLVDHK
jgi:hypothetical protein